MFDKSKVKYVVESNGEDYSLMYRIICNDEWYCFYEPTAVKVNWDDVEIGIKKLFPDADKIKPTGIVAKFVTIEE